MDESTGGGSGAGASAIVDAWLEPLPGDPCGPDLEYDDDFREMEKAANGRPATQFDEGVAPDWRSVLGRTQSLFERTRDLRVALYWTRARVRLDGANVLNEGLRLAEGLLERYWDELHPRPEDGDAYARVNALADATKSQGLLGDLRESLVVNDRAIGELHGRDIEIALGLLEPRIDETPPSRGAIEQMLGEAASNRPELREFPAAALARVNALQQLMRDRVGYAAAPELDPLTKVLAGLAQMMATTSAGSSEQSSMEPDADDHPAADAGGDAAPRRGGRGAGLSGNIDTRTDALRAIDLVCEYLERTEPTNPAQLLLRRARKLVNKNFVELVQELAPEALAEVAKVMGLSAEELSALRGQD